MFKAHHSRYDRLVFHSNGVTATPRAAGPRVTPPLTIRDEKHALYFHDTSPNAKVMYWHQLTHAGELSPVVDNGDGWS